MLKHSKQSHRSHFVYLFQQPTYYIVQGFPQTAWKLVSNAESVRSSVGFINKGNTYYANSILQILSVVPNLWSRVPSESNTLSPMLQAISLNIAVKKNSTKPVDPS